MSYICFKQRSGYLDDDKPKVSAIGRRSLKSKYGLWNRQEQEGQDDRSWLNTKSSSTPHAQHWSARVERCVWTELCLCGASLPPGDNGRHQLLFLGLLYLLRYVLQTRIWLRSFPRDVNLLPRQQCLSHLALGAGLTPGWVHSKFVGQWSPSAISCVNHHFLAGLKPW